MIKFESTQSKYIWKVQSDDSTGEIELRLVTSSITNKFHIVADFITRMSKFSPQFSDWLFSFLNSLEKHEEESERSEIVSKNVEVIKKYADEYLDSLNIDFSNFVDESKAKKGSIFFAVEEIEKIVRLSAYLKIYSLVFNSEYQLGAKAHSQIYNRFAEDVIETKIASKLFDVVKSKTFRYNLSDKFMWDYIKTIQCKDIGVHIIQIFNFIMNNIIILCEEDRNPITYFVGVVDESVKWFLRSVYKGNIVYSDEVATEDIHQFHVSNLRSYTFNDTLGRLKTIAFEKIYEELDRDSIQMTDASKSDQYIIDFNNRLSSIEYISPLCYSLVFPVLSKVTDIPYSHFKTIIPEHAAVLSYYLYQILIRTFKNEFQTLFLLLEYFPLSNPSLSTTYKLKAIHDFLKVQNKTKSFYGFNTKIFPHRALCHFVGSISRIVFQHLISGKKMTGIPLSKIESEAIKFYTMFFSGKLGAYLDKVRGLIEQDF